MRTLNAINAFTFNTRHLVKLKPQNAKNRVGNTKIAKIDVFDARIRRLVPLGSKNTLRHVNARFGVEDWVKIEILKIFENSRIPP